MKRTILATVSLVLGGVLLAHCLLETGFGQDREKGKQASATYVHAVYFYLKSDAPKGTATDLIKDSHEMLAKIPTVKKLWTGRPAKQATDIAVKDYDVGLMILFEDYQGLKTYLDHPLHVQYVEKHKQHIEKVNVYDFDNQTK